jgi:hypothetical protein
MSSQLDELLAENEKLKLWISDLQSGMFINCVYCGHRYGPKDNTPPTMAEVLKEHIKVCPKHPLSKTIATLISLGQWTDEMCSWKDAGVRLRAVCKGTLDGI